MYRQTARSIFNKVRPKCLVIGNANRPLEFSLWAEAKAKGVVTVLLPYTEITLKHTRFLSLCRGASDLVLPFSKSSAAQMRRLSQCCDRRCRVPRWLWSCRDRWHG